MSDICDLLTSSYLISEQVSYVFNLCKSFVFRVCCGFSSVMKLFLIICFNSDQRFVYQNKCTRISSMFTKYFVFVQIIHLFTKKNKFISSPFSILGF